MPMTYGDLLHMLRDSVGAINGLAELEVLLGIMDEPENPRISTTEMVPVEILMRALVVLREVSLQAGLHGYNDQAFNEVESEIWEECLASIATGSINDLITKAAKRLGTQKLDSA